MFVDDAKEAGSRCAKPTALVDCVGHAGDDMPEKQAMPICRMPADESEILAAHALAHCKIGTEVGPVLDGPQSICALSCRRRTNDRASAGCVAATATGAMLPAKVMPASGLLIFGMASPFAKV